MVEYIKYEINLIPIIINDEVEFISFFLYKINFPISNLNAYRQITQLTIEKKFFGVSFLNLMSNKEKFQLKTPFKIRISNNIIDLYLKNNHLEDNEIETIQYTKKNKSWCLLLLYLSIENIK